MAVKVMLTLDDELHASIERMAEIQGLPKATLIRGLLEGQKPVIDAMIKTFEEVAAGKDKEKALQEFLAASLESVASEIRKD
jgi:predicted transcriptional regulator